MPDVPAAQRWKMHPRARDCLWWISLRPLGSTLTKISDELQHRVVYPSVGGEDVAAARRERRSVKRCHAAASLGNDQRTAGDVPRLQIALPEAVHSPGRHPAEIDGRRTKTADRARLTDERPEEPDDFIHARVNVVRKSRDQHGVEETI